MLKPHEQLRIMSKGAHTIVNEEELLSKLQKSFDSNTPLTIKLGLDPSAPDIHLGHAVVLRKIKQMQDLGHHVVIIIGDFTGKIGDPTGKSKGRVALSDEQVRENAKTYCEQIFKILDKEKTEVRFNSEWLSRLTFEAVIKLAATTTVARILERDDFQKRYQNQIPIGVHEFFYPLMQAYDSVEIKADIELGGTDQTFNILMGRTLQKTLEQEQQIAMFMPLLEGLDGAEKMSKSLGNYIGIFEPSEVMFKKVMEVPDKLIIKYYELATDEHPDEIEKIREALQNGTNPRDVKYRLAKTITSLYHTAEAVEKAMEYYDTAFGKKAIPEDIPSLVIEGDRAVFSDIIPKLIEMDFVKSKSEFARLVNQGGVQLNGEKLLLKDMNKHINSHDVVRIGKKRFIKLLYRLSSRLEGKEMHYTVKPEVFALNPRLQFGILVGRGLKNTPSTPSDTDALRSAESYISQLIGEGELRSLPVIQEYRSTMEKAGINPNKYPPSTEAMLKRVLKGSSLPEINALVDLCNAVSLENQISLGGHDLRDINEDLSVCFSKGTERFLPFGAEEYETVEEGELVFTSGNIVQTRKWIWRQSELGKMTLDTKDVFFQLVGFDYSQGSQLAKALDSLERLIVERFGGTCQRYIVNQSNPTIKF